MQKLSSMSTVMSNLRQKTVKYSSTLWGTCCFIKNSNIFVYIPHRQFFFQLPKLFMFSRIWQTVKNVYLYLINCFLKHCLNKTFAETVEYSWIEIYLIFCSFCLLLPSIIFLWRIEFFFKLLCHRKNFLLAGDT